MPSKQPNDFEQSLPPATLHLTPLKKLSLNFVNFIEILGTCDVIRAEEVVEEQKRLYNIWHHDRTFWIREWHSVKIANDTLKAKVKAEVFIRNAVIITSIGFITIILSII